MQTIDFLSAVLPPPGNGFYCGVELRLVKVAAKDKEGVEYEKEELRPKTHAFVESIAELAADTAAFSERGYEAYFALATFETRANRTASNSAYMRSFFLDIDTGSGKQYPTPAVALSALREWVVVAKLPKPHVVMSGAGLHVYFPFGECVPISTWKPQAEALKRACTAAGLGIDLTVTADAARVLRCPGTRNRKRDGDVEVKYILAGDSAISFDAYAELLADWREEKATLAPVAEANPLLDAAPAFARVGSSIKTDLFEGAQHNFERILERGDDGCLQIQQYIKTAEADGSEPLFRAVMSIAKFCVDGEKHAIELGRLHPYSVERIERKYADIGGPQKCDTFDRAFPGVCASCKHRGKISTPISLGRELRPQEPIPLAQPTPTVLSEPAEQCNAPDAHVVLTQTPPPTHQMPEPPPGYLLKSDGVFAMLDTPEGSPRLVKCADIPFYASCTYDRLGERFVQFIYIEHGVVKDVILPMVSVTGKDEAIKALARIGIMVPNNGDQAFRQYIKATIAEAKKQPVISMPTNLGWQPDDSFAFDKRMFSRNGEVQVPMHGFENINDTLGVKGTLDGWRLVVAGVMRLDRWDIISMMAISFGSPLMRFTGLNGLTFHLCGNDSGRGKTLCQRLASSVWGVPDKFRTTPNTSPLAMVNRLGMLGSLPLLVDEITHKGRAEAEWFPEFLSQMSDGRGKDRMESQTNAERRNTTTWASIALMTSNKHMLDYLTAERAHGSEGEIRRLVEIAFNRPLNMDELTKSLLFDTLPENYGVAGETYARWLTGNVDVAQRIVKSTYAEIFKLFGASGDERFWIAGCACIVAGVRLAGRNYANVVEIPVIKIIAYLYEVIKTMRLETGRTKRTALDVLNEFTKRNYGKIITVNDKVMRIAGLDVVEVQDKRDLCARVEKQGGYIHYYIEERELKAFCSSLSFGYTEFKNELHTATPIQHVQKNLLAGAKGPALSVRCISVKVREADIKDIFFDIDGKEITEQNEEAAS